jgi:molybdopterin synthase catalytic subunit
LNRKIALSESPLSIDEQYEFLRDDSVGGICLFIGTIRNKNLDKGVERLEMEAYPPMAIKQIEKLCEQAEQTWQIKKSVVVHRTGKLAIGDIAVIIGVASVHRPEAFAACKWLIDELKKEVPIWKNEFYEDGSSWLVPHP